MQYMTTVLKLGKTRTLSLISSPIVYLGLSWDDLYSLYGWCAHLEVLETSSFETAIMFAGAARGVLREGMAAFLPALTRITLADRHSCEINRMVMQHALQSALHRRGLCHSVEVVVTEPSRYEKGVLQSTVVMKWFDVI